MQARRHKQGGMTLVEILVVLAVMGLVMGSAVAGFRAVLKSELRSQTGRLAAAIRYCYDRSITTGAYYRIHFDLDAQSYKVEVAKEPVLLGRDKERAGKSGEGLDQDKEAAAKEAEEEQRYGTTKGLPPELMPPPRPRKGRFEAFKDSTVPAVKLKRVRVVDVYTPRQEEPYVKGHAYLHFFPDGHTERAVIHMGPDEGQDEEQQYSLVVQALTGRVEILPGHYRPPSDFDRTDDAGNRTVDR